MNTAVASLAGSPAVATGKAEALCLHCATPVATGERFCCTGCAGAHALIRGLGLDSYYQLRAAGRPVGEIDDERIAWGEFVQVSEAGRCRAELIVDGMHCAACLWLIEHALRAHPAVVRAQVSATTRRLVLEWKGDAGLIDELAGTVSRLGYRCLPLTPDAVEQAGMAEEKSLLRAMGVAGFAAANIMLLSVSVWSGHVGDMGTWTRDLMHAVSAVIAIPAIAYAGLPFFRSAASALRRGRSNMDVPISIGVILATAVSLAEMLQSGPHAYFDAAVTLLFFLLIGRYLETRARGYARRTAQQLLAWTAQPVSVETDAGVVQRPAQRVAIGDRVVLAAGERIPVDGFVLSGQSAIDASLVSGETLPQPVAPGDRVFAGAINIDAPLRLQVTATGAATLIGGIVRLMEAAEQGRSRFVRLSEKVARYYAPVVHLTALLSFLGWMLIGDADWRSALLIAAAVLIITCPCALALAVPAVQVAASSRLMKSGILMKSATALERAAAIDTIVFDKTGTLTVGRPRLVNAAGEDGENLQLAARLALRSRHPLCRALVAAAGPGVLPLEGVEEVPGQGMRWIGGDGEWRLGHARFTGATAAMSDGCSELWFSRPGAPPHRFRFQDDLRPDATETVAELKRRGLKLLVLSGDRPDAVRSAAEATGIADWRAGVDPQAKADAIAGLKASGHRVLMVGDGLNDAVALTLADASLSPASGIDIAQNAADAVFQGDRLAAVPEFLDAACASRRLAIQNLALALVYNLIAVPLAIAGMVTPLVAAIAMSGSSLLVVGNALRLGRLRLGRG